MTALAAWFALVLLGSPSAFAQDADAENNYPTFDPANCVGTPLLTPQEEREYKRRQMNAYMQARKKSQLSQGDVETLEQAAQYQVGRMTMEEVRSDIPRVIDSIVRDIDMFASEAAKKVLLEELTHSAAELLTQCPIEVRLNAMVLLARLNSMPTSGFGPSATPAVPYWQTAPLQMHVLKDVNQPPAVRYAAVVGLRRILAQGDPPRQVRDEILVSLVNALQTLDEKKTELRCVIADAIGHSNLVTTLRLEPVGVEALGKMMVNEDEAWDVRVEAAKSLSQLPYDSSFNVRLMVYETVRLTLQMAKAYNERPNEAHWLKEFYTVYFSFRPEYRQQATENGWGFMTIAEKSAFRDLQPYVQSARQTILPVVNSVTAEARKREIPQDRIEALESWLQENEPESWQLHPKIARLDNGVAKGNTQGTRETR